MEEAVLSLMLLAYDTSVCFVVEDEQLDYLKGVLIGFEAFAGLIVEDGQIDIDHHLVVG